MPTERLLSHLTTIKNVVESYTFLTGKIPPPDRLKNVTIESIASTCIDIAKKENKAERVYFKATNGKDIIDFINMKSVIQKQQTEQSARATMALLKNLGEFLDKNSQYRDSYNELNKFAQEVESAKRGSELFRANPYQTLQAAMILHELQTYDTVHSAVLPGNGKSFIQLLLADYMTNVLQKKVYLGTLNRTLTDQL